MYRFRFLILLLFIITNLIVKGQEKTTPVSFYVRGKKVSNVNYYLIKKEHKLGLINQNDNGLILNKNISSEFKILAIYKNHQVIVPIIRFKEVLFINIYFDNRIFNNIIREKFNEPFFKYLFRKNYLIDLGQEDVYVTFKPKHKYKI